MFARLGGRRLRRDDFLDLLEVRKDERVSEEALEAKEDDESAQFLCAQRVIACSKRVARVPRRPPARRKEPEDMVENDLRDAADPSSAEGGIECVDASSGVWQIECRSPRRMSSWSTNSVSMNSSPLIKILGGKSCGEDGWSIVGEGGYRKEEGACKEATVQ
jgi:hypothetical protein